MICSINIFQRFITGFVLLIALATLFFYLPPIILTCCITLAALIMLTELRAMMPTIYNFTLLALWYPIIPCVILIYFNHSPVYKNLLLALCCMVFTFDTACYLVGSCCSKLWTTHKILPAISPGKSYEGFCGGLVATTALLWWMTHRSDLQIFLLNLTICVIAFAGDMFESYLKRSAKIKDSGTILPGHGGMLDRFDAILAVSYFFFIFKDYLVTISL